MADRLRVLTPHLRNVEKGDFIIKNKRGKWYTERSRGWWGKQYVPNEIIERIPEWFEDADFHISVKTYNMIDNAMKEYHQGELSEPIKIDD